MYVVFLSNKLISCDTILPVVMEAHQRTGRRVEFYCFTPSTYAGLKQNVVLWDAIHSTGTLKQVGRESRGIWSTVIHRIRSIGFVLRLASLSLLARVDFIHFRMLDAWPLRLLFVLNRNRTWAFEADSFGESKGMRRLADIKGVRNRRRLPPVGGPLAAFQPAWEFLRHPHVEGRPKFVFGPTRTRKIWLDYVRSRSEEYFSREFANANYVKSDDICVFILGWFGPLDFMRRPEDTLTLFHEVMDVLAEECGDVPIFLKPHVITDMDVVMDAVARHPNKKFVVSYLHPSVLASRARFFIGTYYSTTFGDAALLNVPTIEYTSYSEAALNATDGGSMFAQHTTYFINRDQAALRRAIRECLSGDKRPFPEGITGDPSGLMERLTGIP